MISLQRVLWLKHWDLTDFTYTVVPGACWSVLEPALGVVNACLPTIRPVLQKVFNKDALAWFKANRKYPAMDRPLKHNYAGSSSLPNDSDKNRFLRMKDLRSPLTKPPISADHSVASDNRMRSDVVEPDSNAIQVISTWDVETMEDGSHHV